MIILSRFLLIGTLVPSSCWSFVVPPGQRNVLVAASVVSLATTNSNDDDEPDLFEYFDPLLSPHAYPNGISPNQEPVRQQQQQQQQQKSSVQKSPSRKAFGFRTTTEPEQTDKAAPPTLEASAAIESQLNPTETSIRPTVDTTVTFDPTISPHEYAKGTPDIVVGDKDAVYINTLEKNSNNRKVGILLMDHGSRNESSNQRLHELARLYEQSLVADDIEDDSAMVVRTVVRAAHMEIASPSIPEGIQQLLDHNVDEIICHPYFLSPGRHVREDVPRIVAETVESLQIDIPVTTTDPVGSNTQVMINAIHTLVKQSATVRLKTAER